MNCSFACISPVAFYYAVLCCVQWRTQFRKDMNRSEAQANNRAIDSLINYETVKYCGNEEHEVKRYDECMHTYQVRTALRVAVRAAGTLVPGVSTRTEAAVCRCMPCVLRTPAVLLAVKCHKGPSPCLLFAFLVAVLHGCWCYWWSAAFDLFHY